MTQTRKYGTTCPKCERAIQFDKIELPHSATKEDLLNALVAQEWKAKIVRCPNPLCNYEMLYKLDDLSLLE
jgi:hypothetical protein